jgi:branched-chain amino acid transport system permease protein
MTIALQVLISGLAAGGVYGLFAAGHSLVYRLTGIVNFAFGDLVGLGIFATLLVQERLTRTRIAPHGRRP